MPEIPEAFELSEQDFQARYGFNKPERKADNLVIGCLYAIRSARARDYLQEKGYTGMRLIAIIKNKVFVVEKIYSYVFIIS